MDRAEDISLPQAVKYVFNQGVRVPAKIVTGQAVTNASGIATFYFTDDMTNTGNNLINTIYSAHVDANSTVPISIRKGTTANSVTATVTQLVTAGVVVLGISVLATISQNPVSGITVDFTIFGI